MLRNEVVHHEEDLSFIEIGKVLRWLQTMAKHAAAGPQRGYRIETVVIMVRMAGLLRADSKIKECTKHCSQLLGFPAGWIT